MIILKWSCIYDVKVKLESVTADGDYVKTFLHNPPEIIEEHVQKML